jgi:hypothetical protein
LTLNAALLVAFVTFSVIDLRASQSARPLRLIALRITITLLLLDGLCLIASATLKVLET